MYTRNVNKFPCHIPPCSLHSCVTGFDSAAARCVSVCEADVHLCYAAVRDSLVRVVGLYTCYTKYISQYFVLSRSAISEYLSALVAAEFVIVTPQAAILSVLQCSITSNSAFVIT